MSAASLEKPQKAGGAFPSMMRAAGTLHTERLRMEKTLTTADFPPTWVHLGMALDPLDCARGFQKAVNILGVDRVRSICDMLMRFDTHPAGLLIDSIVLSWRSPAPILPAVHLFKQLTPAALLSVLGAIAMAGDGKTFNNALLDALAPSVRALAGLPSVDQVKDAQAAIAP